MNLFISRTLHTDVLTESARNYYLGQVYGLRAYYMYQLYRSWGDVVFTEEPSLGLKWVNWQRRRLRLPKSLSR